ncbi:biopolymer transporter ExbD [bacterium]|nr:biopolymer transporter ExbD [bacterium]
MKTDVRRIRILEDEDFTFNMTPMIDVVLQLIIFFMLSASFGAPSAQFGIQLPPSASVEEVPTREIIIALDEDQRIFIDREEVTLNQLYARLRGMPSKTRTISVQADRRVPYGMVMKVISVSRKSGFFDFAFDVIYEENLVQ